MVSDAVKEAVSKIETKEDYNNVLQKFKLSSATVEQKEEAIRYLKTQHPSFDTTDRLPTKELLSEIEAGQADIDDIGGY